VKFVRIAMLNVTALSALSCAHAPLSSTTIASRVSNAPLVADAAAVVAAPDPSPVALEVPMDRARARAVLVAPTRWQLANGLRVEHRRFSLANTVHVRLVVSGVGSESAAGRSLRESLRLALALEEGGTRRNPAPTFAASLAQAGTELRVDAGRRGLVLSMDASATEAPFVLRKLGELVSEPAVARETPSFAAWIARRTHPTVALADGTSAALRRAALSTLRGTDLPWSPREWIEVAPTFAWAQDEDSTSRALARESLRAGAMTLVVAGDLPLESLRASLVAERWSAVARGNGIAVAPLPSLHAESPTSAVYRAAERPAFAVAWRWSVSEHPAEIAAMLVLASSIERCANSVSVALYDDVARPVLVLTSNGGASAGEAIAAMLAEPARVLGDACFARSFEAVKTALIDQRYPRDPARWADVRAWAAHDGRADESEQALLDAITTLTVEQAQSAARTVLTSAPRALVSAGPSGTETALCAVSGVRAVRVGNESRACP
jgi:hypothetical protein